MRVFLLKDFFPLVLTHFSHELLDPGLRQWSHVDGGFLSVLGKCQVGSWRHNQDVVVRGAAGSIVVLLDWIKGCWRMEKFRHAGDDQLQG